MLATAIYNRRRLCASMRTGGGIERQIMIQLSCVCRLFLLVVVVFCLNNIKCLYLDLVSHTHTRQRVNRMLEIPSNRSPACLPCPFVMLIGQITRHRSKLNTWLITLKMFRLSKASHTALAIDFTLSAGRSLIDRQEFNQNLIIKLSEFLSRCRYFRTQRR